MWHFEPFSKINAKLLSWVFPRFSSIRQYQAIIHPVKWSSTLVRVLPKWVVYQSRNFDLRQPKKIEKFYNNRWKLQLQPSLYSAILSLFNLAVWMVFLRQRLRFPHSVDASYIAFNWWDSNLTFKRSNHEFM